MSFLSFKFIIFLTNYIVNILRYLQRSAWPDYDQPTYPVHNQLPVTSYADQSYPRQIMTAATFLSLLVLVSACQCQQEDNIIIGRQCFQNVEDLHSLEDSFKLSRELEKNHIKSNMTQECGTFVFFPKFVFLFSKEKFSASIFNNSIGGERKKRSLTSSFSTQFLRSKLFSNLPDFQNFFRTKSSSKPVRNEENEIRNIGNEIDNFRISGKKTNHWCNIFNLLCIYSEYFVYKNNHLSL